ncbi:glycoside hydrolase family 5 protein [Lapidilactobacillus bayanensis]|uniref:glycoside hydrolase family 5 protein n=1 Tax=Lapidilactobacillus bayanensis TaxID=2485998 RepID=UPI000F7A1CC5|nr:cellulase family glycosylhydrolase [Lapidilactobacillus bayanensis]
MITSFLHTKGRQIVNEQDQPILMKGWGIGNWLLTEGYMWTMHGQKFDRPRRIEQTIAELIGADAAESFWKQYREHYFTEADAQYIHQQGYNSIRIPFNARLFLTAAGQIDETNFYLLDRAIKWSKEHDLYVWLDMHGAPGGQTGANIDDSVGDVPNLYMVPEYWRQALNLWQFIAQRYADEPAVAGYDLLNEPIRPRTGSLQDFDYLLPKLSQFYTEAIAMIRKVDTRHMFSLEGYHWASDPSVFNQQYDDNYVIHFHRYGVLPSEATFAEFLKVSKQFNVPLWLGETGENINTWYSGMTKLCEQYQVSYHFWPYKKMGKNNGGVTIRRPENWQLLVDYVVKGDQPKQQTIQAVLAELLENLKFANCQQNHDVDCHILRRAPFAESATCFDTDPVSYHATVTRNNFAKYRQGTNIEILEPEAKRPSAYTFDVYLDEYQIRLHEGEYVSYTYTSTHADQKLLIKLDPAKTEVGTVLAISQNGQETQEIKIGGDHILVDLIASEQDQVRLTVKRGVIVARQLVLQA